MNPNSKTAALSDTTLIYIAPDLNTGGVGDYASDFVARASSIFREVTEVRTPGPGSATLKDVIQTRKKLRELLREAKANGTPVLIHAELSAGAIVPFWALAGVTDFPVVATVHDPALTVWWPLRTKLLARSRFINHGLHYPLRKLEVPFERRLLRGVRFVTLSDLGAAELKKNFPQNDIDSVRHFILKRNIGLAPTERPLAVGLFGHAYRGKGFDQLKAIRDLLPEEIGIVVAGRGTENLPQVEGVSILGGVDGIDEQNFFESVRLILLPYQNSSRYGEIYSVSGVVARAMAHATPVVSSSTGTLGETAQSGGSIAVNGSIDRLVSEAARVAHSQLELDRMSRSIDKLRTSRSVEQVVESFKSIWSDVVQ